jgi:hypothetical protein
MSDISVKELAHAPFASAGRFLSAFFEAHKNPDGEARINLRAHGVTQAATVKLTPANVAGDMTPHYAVAWESAAGGIFPVFHGTLSIGAGDDYDVFWLVLEGSYQPPGGLAGKVFDAVVGHRAALETAQGLLAEIREDTEKRFAVEEAAKPHA